MDFPTLGDIARRWYAGPNAERIAALLRRFFVLERAQQELFLLGLDIEEGILPRIHPGGRASRQLVVNDARLFAGGGLLDYRHILAADRTAATSPSPTSSPAPAASGTAPAEAARSARGVEGRSPPASVAAPREPLRAMTPVEVIAEDELAMAMMFPQFVLRRASGRNALPCWTGIVRPLGGDEQAFELRATYQVNHLSPLQLTVLRPTLPPRTPHRYVNGDLCTFYPPLGSWLRGRSGDDLVELLRFAVTWLVRYMCWQVFDGWWPGVEAPHDPAYLAGHLRDDDYCPYHSPSRWGDCCKAEHVHAAQAQMQRREMLDRGIVPPAPCTQTLPTAGPARMLPVALSPGAETSQIARPTRAAAPPNRPRRPAQGTPHTGVIPPQHAHRRRRHF